MISFPKRERAQRAAACVGVDAGKFSHTLVVRPHGRPDSKPFSFPTTRTGFDAAVAFLKRTRAELHKLPNYYPLRNHLIEFLVTRSRELALAPEPDVEARRNPPIVRPTASFNPHASTATVSQSPAQAAPILAASARVSAA